MCTVSVNIKNRNAVERTDRLLSFHTTRTQKKMTPLTIFCCRENVLTKPLPSSDRKVTRTDAETDGKDSWSMCFGGRAVDYWLRRYATSRKVACLIPDEAIAFFNIPNPSGRTRSRGLLSL
jgi:hypothetical protein